MREFTNKRLAKAQFMANIFEKYDKANLPVRDNAVIFDGEGCSIDVFRAFDRLNEERKNKFRERDCDRC
jgi:hypothetical protein